MNAIFNKPWTKSLTAWGVVIYAGIGSAQGSGLLPEGTAETVSAAMASATEVAGSIADTLQGVGALLVVLGLRKAANPTTA